MHLLRVVFTNTSHRSWKLSDLLDSLVTVHFIIWFVITCWVSEVWGWNFQEIWPPEEKISRYTVRGLSQKIVYIGDISNRVMFQVWNLACMNNKSPKGHWSLTWVQWALLLKVRFLSRLPYLWNQSEQQQWRYFNSGYVDAFGLLLLHSDLKKKSFGEKAPQWPI